MSSSDPRDALSDLFGCIKGTFKRYDRTARRKAWQAVTTGKGASEVKKLIDNPGQQVTGIPTFLKFKEWITRSGPTPCP